MAFKWTQLSFDTKKSENNSGLDEHCILLLHVQPSYLELFAVSFCYRLPLQETIAEQNQNIRASTALLTFVNVRV